MVVKKTPKAPIKTPAFFTKEQLAQRAAQAANGSPSKTQAKPGEFFTQEQLAQRNAQEASKANLAVLNAQEQAVAKLGLKLYFAHGQWMLEGNSGATTTSVPNADILKILTSKGSALDPMIKMSTKLQPQTEIRVVDPESVPTLLDKLPSHQGKVFFNGKWVTHTQAENIYHQISPNFSVIHDRWEVDGKTMSDTSISNYIKELSSHSDHYRPLYEGKAAGSSTILTHMLQWAADMGKATIAHQLLEAGAYFNAKDAEGKSPLEVASAHGHVSIVKELINLGADVNAQDKEGHTALEVAVQNKHVDVVLLLLAAGADVHLQDHEGYTALEVAPSKMIAQILEKAENISINPNLDLDALRDFFGVDPGSLEG